MQLTANRLIPIPITTKFRTHQNNNNNNDNNDDNDDDDDGDSSNNNNNNDDTDDDNNYVNPLLILSSFKPHSRTKALFKKLFMVISESASLPLSSSGGQRRRGSRNTMDIAMSTCHTLCTYL